jgi:hypothetical protein
MSTDNESKGSDRRDALECMIWAGTGVIWTLSGGVPKSSQLLGIGAALSGARVSAPNGANLCRSDVMTLGKIEFGILIFPSLAATGATLARDISKHLTNPKHLANSRQVANVKGDKVPPNGAAASVVLHHVGPQAPIVMGRSVSLHYKTKLHHVNVKPFESNENSTSADSSQ